MTDDTTLGPDSPEPLDIADDPTALLLRDVLGRAADAVQPSSDGLARILAAVHAGTPDPDAAPTDDGAGDDGGEEESSLVPVLIPIRSRDEHPVPGQRTEATRGSRGRFAHWVPTLSAAAAVVLLAGSIGAVRLGVVKPERLGPLVGVSEETHDSMKPRTVPPPLPVYLISRQNGRWALVREFVPTPVSDPQERLRTALSLAVAGTGSDPDLTSAWSQRHLGSGPASGDKITAEIGDERITVQLPAALIGAGTVASGAQPDRPTLAAMALQQLAWTADAVVGHDAPVRVEGPTADAVLFDDVALGRDVLRAMGPDDPRAPVWISSVRDGQQLRPGAAEVSGDAAPTADAAGVRWTLSRADGTTVDSGVQPLDRQNTGAPRRGERAPFTVRFTLPGPGSFRLTVSAPWATTGNPAGTWTDTKTLQVI